MGAPGILGCAYLRCFVRQVIGPVGMYQIVDPSMPLGPQQNKAGTESPSFLGHARGQCFSEGVASLSVSVHF